MRSIQMSNFHLQVRNIKGFIYPNYASEQNQTRLKLLSIYYCSVYQELLHLKPDSVISEKILHYTCIINVNTTEVQIKRKR